MTNIDADHMETYGHDFGKLKRAFVDFLQRLPFYGVAVLCIDDPHVRAILPDIAKPVVTYGLAEDAQLRAVDVDERRRADALRRARRQGAPTSPVELALAGVHNVQNALAAIAVGREVGVARRGDRAGARRVQGRRPALPAPRRRRARRPAARSR